MVLLILIAVAQLVVLVLLLGVVVEQIARQEIERATVDQRVRGLQRQTIDTLLEAAAEASTPSPLSGGSARPPRGAS